MPLVCVDASVVLKLVLDESDSQLAHSLWQSWWGGSLRPIAPAFLAYEIATAIRKRAHRRLITPTEADTALSTFEELAIAYLQPKGMVRHAYAMAAELALPTIYDCLYLVVAQAYSCDFWTADARFQAAVAPRFPSVRLLGDYRETPQP